MKDLDVCFRRLLDELLDYVDVVAYMPCSSMHVYGASIDQAHSTMH